MPNTRRLLVVCQVFHPDTTSTSQLFSPLLAEMAAKGWDIEVLCGYPANATDQSLPRKETWRGIKIQRCGLRVALKKDLFSRGLAYVAFMAQAGFKLLRADKDAQWFGVTNPPFVAWVMGFAAWVCGRSFSYMFLDLHPEGMVALGDLSSQSWYVKLWKRLNGKAYHRADRLVVLGRDMPAVLHSYGLPDKYVYLPHWSGVESEDPIPFEASPMVERWNLTGKFVVQYSGNMGLWHDMETFVRAAKKLEHLNHIQFVFVGGGIRREGAEKLAKELGVSNIQWREFVPIEDLSNSLAACHVSLISLSAGLEGVAVPSKLYGILASGRAVVAQVPEESEVAYTVKEHECGLVVKPGDVDGLADLLERLSKDPQAVKIMGDKAFAAYKNNYRLDQALEHFERLFSGDPMAEATIGADGKARLKLPDTNATLV